MTLEALRVIFPALGRQGWRVRYVHSLESVKLCTKSRFDPGWFDAEEEYRQQLIRSAAPAAFERINLSLKSVIDRMSDPVMEAAVRNLEGGDLQILKVAAGVVQLRLVINMLWNQRSVPGHRGFSAGNSNCSNRADGH